MKQIESVLTNNTKAGGLSVAIASSQAGPYLSQSGLSIVQDHVPVDESHLFGIGSITKVYVAVVVLQLIEENSLTLSDTVGQHLPEATYRDIENAASATIEQLLSHTAGIDSWEDDSVWQVDGRGSNLSLDRLWVKTDTLDYVRRPRRTAPEPGQWYYSNTNYTLLGLAIEKITGRKAEQEIRQRILEPLGMKHTFLEGHETGPEQDVAHRYHHATTQFQSTAGVAAAFPFVQDELIDVTGSNLSVSWLAGGYISSPSDLITFASALKNGQLLKSHSMMVLQQWRSTTLRNHEMGHGLFRQHVPGHGTWLGHSGGVLGFGAQLWWAEGGDCVVSILSNAGTVLAGPVPGGTTGLLRESEFLDLARQLVKS
jgi:D-alanyl-D-alanine carboxypeptidase